MRKEFEIQGCIEVPMELTEDEFYTSFIGYIEDNRWSFGGGIHEIIDGFYINADGSRGRPVLEDDTPEQPTTSDRQTCLHDRLVDELFKVHSLAALIFLIDAGRELEFTYKGVKCFLSKSGSAKAVSLWVAEDEQAFDSIEDLVEHALVCGQALMNVFHEAELETLF